MVNVSQNFALCQEKNQTPNEESQLHRANLLEQFPAAEDFFTGLHQEVKEMVRITLTQAINEEFRQFIGAAPYQRGQSRQDQRNGFRTRAFETSYGVIDDLRIPRARHGSFMPKLFGRWQRREKRIPKLLAEIFLRGVSTRKIKHLAKLLFGRDYSAATVSTFNRTLKEEYLQWMNRPIAGTIRYLFLDAINLKIRRHWVSKEALLCAIGITEEGHKEFLGFILGGRESTQSWESLLLQLVRRGLDPQKVALVTSDGNPGLLKALDTVVPDAKRQRCIVHKMWNIIGHCPKSLRGMVPAEVKRIFCATSKEEALRLFAEWKIRWQSQLAKVVECLEKDLKEVLCFYDFPYRHWRLIRSTNVIERAFKEFRRRTKVMDTFPTEESCCRIMFALAQMLNEGWKHKPITDF
jgi:putative transposase